MRRILIFFLIFVAFIAQALGAPQASKPLAKGQVMDLVSAGMETQDLVKAIRERGIDFDLTEEYLQDLRKAGAQEAVIQALQAARPKPLTRRQVLELLTGHVPSQRAATLVNEHGIDFTADDQYLDTLRIAGADETLISALREASAALMGELAVETLPSAEVYLDGALQGRANTQGALRVKVKPGKHVLKVTLAGKKDYQQDITLASRETTNIVVALESNGPPPVGTVRLNPKDGLEYVWIVPGTFMMGCSPGDTECDGDEKPYHSVTLTKGFWIGKLEATVAAYKRFGAATGKPVPGVPTPESGTSVDAVPIVNISWNDAREFCAWVGGRLPTEAEWEYAARGGSNQGRYGAMVDIGWSDHAHAGAQKRPNGFGLYDVLGNVSEWVNDWWGSNYPSDPVQDPTGAASGTLRAIRSGCYRHTDKFSRFSARDVGKPEDKNDGVGVRCAMDAVPQ